MLSVLDIIIIALSLMVTLGIGLWASRRAGKSANDFFLSGRSTPWWVLGISMVATTFSADTPNLVTDIVRQNGVSGNWVWWAFAITGMVTVFIYAQLWRRSGVTTDLEFYELRYSGREAAFLRGFRAVYLGLFFNVIIMGMVTMAAIKIGAVMLGLSAIEVVCLTAIVTVFYSTSGGLKAVLWSDVFQFILAMVGSVWAAYVIINLPEIGGIDALMENPALDGKLNMLPDFSDSEALIALFIIPLAVQWWSAWYPGAEPGGGGYIAQRMLSAKSEGQALAATLLFNIAHYGLRPWPWILIALASLVIFPDLESLAARFPDVEASTIGHDLAYSAMLTYLPSGLMGVVLASLLAAVLSTLSTHLNWGSSYLVKDVYQRFINPEASEKKLVNMGRWFTVILMVLAAGFSLALENALQVFNILLQIGAGTGLIFMARWFWWRVNAYCEIAAMTSSFGIVLYFEFLHATLFGSELSGYLPYLINVALTSAIWISIAFFGPATDKNTLKRFAELVAPMGKGWLQFVDRPIPRDQVGLAGKVYSVLLSLLLVYGLLFGLGFYLMGNTVSAAIAGLMCGLSALGLYSIWKNSLNKTSSHNTPGHTPVSHEPENQLNNLSEEQANSQ